MKPFEAKDYPVFDMFNYRWGLVTAGTPEHWNTCTIAWGSLGTIWGMPGKGKPIATVYINPARYTWVFLKEQETFTVSLFPEAYRKALGYLGSHSGRDGDKVSAAGLTPKVIDGAVTFAEAELTFVCRKIYEAPFDRAAITPEVNGTFYNRMEPHWMFVGEILGCEDRR